MIHELDCIERFHKSFHGVLQKLPTFPLPSIILTCNPSKKYIFKKQFQVVFKLSVQFIFNLQHRDFR